MIVDLVAGTVSGGYYDGSTLVDIENVKTGSTDAPVIFIGDDAANALTGGLQADTLVGGGGNDTLQSSSGNDILDAAPARTRSAAARAMTSSYCARGETAGRPHSSISSAMARPWATASSSKASVRAPISPRPGSTSRCIMPAAPRHSRLNSPQLHVSDYAFVDDPDAMMVAPMGNALGASLAAHILSLQPPEFALPESRRDPPNKGRGGLISDRIARLAFGLVLLALPVDTARAADQARPALPAHERDPLAIDPAADPILMLGRSSADVATFHRLIAAALDHSARLDEAEAGILQAEAAEKEARAGYYPTLDTTVSAQQSIVRHFTNDPTWSVERSRATNRIDATLSARQTLFDFGATGRRIAGASARFRSAGSSAAAEADGTALDAIAAWYDVVTYGALARLAESFVASQGELREAVRQRIDSGLSAPGDLPRVESYIAAAKADLARYHRLETSAQARFAELYGVPAPPDLARAPGADLAPDPAIATRESVIALAGAAPAVEASEAAAAAARQDARAERATTYPRVSAGLDAGRYGLFGDQTNYDVRGMVTIRPAPVRRRQRARRPGRCARHRRRGAGAPGTGRGGAGGPPLPGATWARWSSCAGRRRKAILPAAVARRCWPSASGSRAAPCSICWRRRAAILRSPSLMCRQ